jgi:hypothetical protein
LTHRGAASSNRKLCISRLQPRRIWALITAARLQDRSSVEALETSPKHGSIDLIQQPLRNVNHTTWIDAQEVSVIREMVDCAQRNPVDNRRHAPRIAIVDYVGRLQKRCLTQATDRTSRRISAQHGRTKAVLVQANERFTSRIPAEVFIRHQTRRCCVCSGQPDFELDKSMLAIDGHDKRRRDDRVLTGRDAPEVDQWYREVVGTK